MSLDYKHAFITGGASGIGLGIADALAACGVAITLADIDREALDAVIAHRPSGFFGVVLDVQDRQGWAEAKSRAESVFGPVDILVNNAGITSDGQEIARMNPEDFDRMISIDLVGVFNGISAFAAGMADRGAGHIVNTSSVMGVLPGMKGMGAYSAAKAGVVALTEALRQEMAGQHVGVSVLCPGFVASNLRKNSARVLTNLKNENVRDGSQAMDPRTAGEIVVQGIARNLTYIFTHREYLDHIERRMEAIRDDVAPERKAG